MSTLPADAVHVIDGVRLSACHAGLYRNPQRLDMSLIELPDRATLAAVSTRNACAAAPVVLLREHLQRMPPRYLLINAGNANAGTGVRGLQDARRLCSELAVRAGCAAEQVLPFSTGVIGEYLPVSSMCDAMPALLTGLTEDAWPLLARAIMTTDTVVKIQTSGFAVAGQPCRLIGVAKGSGMVRPDMATMLCFLATDLRVPTGVLQQALERAVAGSFNCISVDGDTSTNDACVLVATGDANAAVVEEGDEAALADFCGALDKLCQELAQMIVRDAEGGSKFVTVMVEQGDSERSCREIAYAIAESPLVKTALTASDPNWGRVLAAIGKSHAARRLDMGRLEIFLGEVCVVRDGTRHAAYSEAQGQQAMRGSEVLIRVRLHAGVASACVWTCDLSTEYVRINSAYRS